MPLFCFGQTRLLGLLGASALLHGCLFTEQELYAENNRTPEPPVECSTTCSADRRSIVTTHCDDSDTAPITDCGSGNYCDLGHCRQNPCLMQMPGDTICSDTKILMRCVRAPMGGLVYPDEQKTCNSSGQGQCAIASTGQAACISLVCGDEPPMGHSQQCIERLNTLFSCNRAGNLDARPCSNCSDDGQSCND